MAKPSFLTIARKELSPAFSLGQFFVRSVLFGWTMEDPERVIKIKHETAIWRGVYPLGTIHSPKFSAQYLWSDSLGILIEPKEISDWPHVTDWIEHRLIHIQNIREFDLVYLHWGNFPGDTSGCPLVGSKPGYSGSKRAVLNSRNFYTKWYPLVYPIIRRAELAGDPETIEIKPALGVTLL